MVNIVCCRSTSFSLFLVSFVVFILAFATPYWYSVQILGIESSHGLWDGCFSAWFWQGGETKCGSADYLGYFGQIQATRVFMCLAFALYAASCVCYCVWMSKSKSHIKQTGAGSIGKTAFATSIVGGSFNIVAVALFGEFYTDVDKWLSWSFVMAALSGSVILINSVITLAITACCSVGETSEHRPVTTATVSPNNMVTVMTSRGQLVQGYPVTSLSYSTVPSGYTTHLQHPGAQPDYTMKPGQNPPPYYEGVPGGSGAPEAAVYQHTVEHI